AREARRSLTRFITTIIIAFSLEALVMVFEANRRELGDAIYPTALFAAAVFALVGLGTYQWLSNKVEPSGESIDETEAGQLSHQTRRSKPSRHGSVRYDRVTPVDPFARCRQCRCVKSSSIRKPPASIPTRATAWS